MNERGRNILKLLASGMSNKEISTQFARGQIPEDAVTLCDPKAPRAHGRQQCQAALEADRDIE